MKNREKSQREINSRKKHQKRLSTTDGIEQDIVVFIRREHHRNTKCCLGWGEGEGRDASRMKDGELFCACT